MATYENKKPDVIRTINENIMKFKYRHDISTDAQVHVGLNPWYLQMRQEVHNLHRIHLKARRAKMRELFIQDFLRERQELQEVDFDYTNTQP
ncbi:hypothetical protein TcasGA2_TC032029 [Tribolium castaneum]|uniref:Uncharacterized protein n=1 Tax=Tribolium castaneum TaxID=7070 RepID=A0A139WNG9_TRICA|nr:hypothetical protein TcasGA2_TC032029 [Tribolium castaneum]